MWLLFLRQAKCEISYETSFIVNGKSIQFSLMECTLISGLKYTQFPQGVKVQANLKEFIKRHFPKKLKKEKGISIDDMMKKLKEMGAESESRKAKRKQTGNDIEKLKMVMLLFISIVLFHVDRSSCKIHNYRLA